MDIAPLLKLLSDETGWGVAGIFLLLFLGALKYITVQNKLFVELLRENINAQNKQTEAWNSVLRIIGPNGDRR